MKSDQIVFAKVEVKVSVGIETVRNLFTCAIEGGSSYWCEKIRPLNEDEKTSVMRDPTIYMTKGFYAWEEESSDDKPRKKKVIETDIVKALELMALRYPDTHFKNALDDSAMDAETGDVFLQLCLFGEVVYG